MKSQIASMIAKSANYTARRPDTAKHKPKVLNDRMVVSSCHPVIMSRDGHTVVATKIEKKVREDHVVWRGGRQYRVTRQGLVEIGV